jgi:hypothetical protein
MDAVEKRAQPPRIPSTPSVLTTDSALKGKERVRILPDSDRAVELDGCSVLGLSIEDEDFYRSFPPDRRKAVLRKVSTRSTLLARTSAYTAVPAPDRLPTDPGPLAPVSHFADRPRQHRQCKDRRPRERPPHELGAMEHRSLRLLHPLHAFR